jgi:hypothetical protein
MKAFVALAAGVITVLSSGQVLARQIRTTFSFVVTIDERVWVYNDNMTSDVNVLMPTGSPWQCVRRKLTLPADGAARGAIECSSDARRTTVSVSAACGLVAEDHHNSATLAGGNSFVTLTANCNTSVFGPPNEWPGF